MHLSIELCEYHRLFQRVVDGLGHSQLAAMGSEVPILTERRDDGFEGRGVRVISRGEGFRLANVWIDD